MHRLAVDEQLHIICSPRCSSTAQSRASSLQLSAVILPRRLQRCDAVSLGVIVLVLRPLSRVRSSNASTASLRKEWRPTKTATVKRARCVDRVLQNDPDGCDGREGCDHRDDHADCDDRDGFDDCGLGMMAHKELEVPATARRRRRLCDGVSRS